MLLDDNTEKVIDLVNMFDDLKDIDKMLNSISTENFCFSNNDSSIYFAEINNRFLYLAKLVITFLDSGSSINNTFFKSLMKLLIS